MPIEEIQKYAEIVPVSKICHLKVCRKVILIEHVICLAGQQTWGNCNSNCNVIVMNNIFKVMEGNL